MSAKNVHDVLDRDGYVVISDLAGQAAAEDLVSQIGELEGVPVNIRRARAADLPAIVALLADDDIGASRESPDDLAPYQRAFELIDADQHEYLAVAERDGEVVGTLQLSMLPGLSRRGALRAQIEGVRVSASARGLGLGETLMHWAISEARTRGCTLIQLTSDKARADAHRFYERLGFSATHEGFKLPLGDSA